MKTWFTPAVATLLALGLAGCAPFAAYRGPDPAPGAVQAFAPSSNDRPETARSPGTRSGLEPSGTIPQRHYLGRIPVPAGEESLIVLLYGDNRPGYRLETRGVEMAAVRSLSWKKPGTWPRGLLFLPILLVESIVPTLDGPRDLISRFTHRFSGGREKPVIEALGRHTEADLVVSTGDLVTDGRRGRHWQDFVQRHTQLRERTLYLAAPGNHERLDSDLARGNYDAAMGDPPADERYWYAVDVPEADARFVFLESDVLTDVRHRYFDSLEDSLSDAQLAWADSILDTPLRHRFVILHHPLVSAGRHVADWAAAGPSRRRARLIEICVRRGVTAVISGHEHLYQRVYLRGQGGGFWHITTGGGGSPLYRIGDETWRKTLENPLPPGVSLDFDSARLVVEHHFCRLALPRGGASRSLPLDVRRVFASGDTKRIDALDLAQPPIQP